MLSLRFSLECQGKPPHILLDPAMVAQELHVGTIVLHSTLGTLLQELLPSQRSKAPVLRDDDFLAPRELVLRATEGLDGGSAVCPMALDIASGTNAVSGNILTSIASAHTQQDLADIDTSHRPVGLAPRATHPRLQSIRSSAR